jgi:uncharacterized protein
MRERIVYLHGFASGANSKKAAFLKQRLEKSCGEVEVPDLAAGDFEHLTITGQLRVVEQAARGGPVALVGSSLGGYVAALYAARHPEVRRVVLLAPAFGFVRLIMERLEPDRLSEWKRTGWLETYHYAEGKPSRVWYGLIEDGMGYEDFPAVTQPALVFQGTRDEQVPSPLAREFASQRPNVMLRLLDSDHELLGPLEEIARGVEEFLA